MKVVILVGAKDYEGAIKAILDNSGIDIYSQTDISGHKESPDTRLGDNWFAVSSEYQKSIVFFSFTEEPKAARAVELVREFNLENAGEASMSRIRAFVMAVEKHD